MLVEHTFITTMEAAETMGTASSFLQERGFFATAKTSFPVGGWTTLEVTRGVANPAKAKSTIEVPQQIHLQWDRGRVDVAASGTPRPRGTGRAFMITGIVRAGDLSGTSRKDEGLAEMLMVIVRALEMLLAQRQPEMAANMWEELDVRLREQAAEQKRKGKRKTIIVLVIFAVLIGLLILSIVLNAR